MLRDTCYKNQSANAQQSVESFWGSTTSAISMQSEAQILSIFDFVQLPLTWHLLSRTFLCNKVRAFQTSAHRRNISCVKLGQLVSWHRRHAKKRFHMNTQNRLPRSSNLHNSILNFRLLSARKVFTESFERNALAWQLWIGYQPRNSIARSSRKKGKGARLPTGKCDAIHQVFVASPPEASNEMFM